MNYSWTWPTKSLKDYNIFFAYSFVIWVLCLWRLSVGTGQWLLIKVSHLSHSHLLRFNYIKILNFYLLASKMKAGRTAIATNQITSFTACVAGVMIVTLTRSFIIWMLRLFRFWRDQIFIRWLYYRPYKLKLQPYHLYYSLVDQSSYQIRIIICPVINITV